VNAAGTEPLCQRMGLLDRLGCIGSCTVVCAVGQLAAPQVVTGTWVCPACLPVSCRWLAPGGIILPDAAQLYVTGMDDKAYLADQSKLWGNRRMGPGEGFALRPALNAVIKHPRVDSVSRAQLITDTQQLLSLDLYKAKLQVRNSSWVWGGARVGCRGCCCAAGVGHAFRDGTIGLPDSWNCARGMSAAMHHTCWPIQPILSLSSGPLLLG
jgi:hypothetical protein